MIIPLNSATYKKEVLDEKAMPVLVVFHSPLCVPCQQFAPTYLAASEKYTELKWCSLNLALVANQSMVKALGIELEGTPTVLVYWRGQVVGDCVGALTQARFTRDVVDPVLKHWRAEV